MIVAACSAMNCQSWLAIVGSAHRLMESNEAGGKIVVRL
jgi:hypothetical protein